MAAKGKTTRSAEARLVQFAHEYLKDRNGKQAAIRAGYSPNGADVTASRLLGKPRVQSILQAHQEKVAAKSGITAELVGRELKRIITCDPRKFYDEEGRIKMPSEWDDDMAAGIASLETVEKRYGDGEDSPIEYEYTRKMKRWDKNAALRLAADILGMAKQPPLAAVAGGLQITIVPHKKEKK